MALSNKLRVGLCEETRSFSSNLMLLFFPILFTPILLMPIKLHAQAAFVESPEPDATSESMIEPHQSQAGSKSDSSEPNIGKQPRPAAGSAAQISTPDEPELVQLLRPTLDIDPQLRSDLDAAFKQMRKRLETDDAFSENLGEDYMAYGVLLKRAGRLDEALEMFIDALHLAKVNNGVYAIEQRPMLQELFDVYYLKNETEDMENSLKRLLWLENKSKGQLPDSTYALLLKAGNYFLDQHLYEFVNGEVALQQLNKANLYFGYAVKRFSDQPLEQRRLPFGELALTNVLRSKVEVKYDRRRETLERSRRFNDLNMSRIKPERYINESYGRGDRYLKKYYQKAVDEENRAEAVQALLSLADYNLLFNRPAGANYYYQKAWSEAQALPADHPIVVSFDGPVALPAFEYAEKRREVKRKKPSVYVPIRFDVEKSGRVVRVQAKPDNDDELKMFTRARRAARRLIFRPIIEQGKLVGARQVSHQVRVQLRADEVDSTEKSNK